MQPNNPVQSNTPNGNKKLVYVLIGFVLLMIGLAYILYESKDSNKKVAPATGPNQYLYSKLDSYKLDSSISGRGISFSKPVEYKLAYLSDNKDQASFSHTLSAPKFAPLGSIHSAVSHNPTPYSDSYVNFLNTTLSDSKNRNYEELVKPIQHFVSSRVSPLYKTDINSAAKKISVANIKNGVWVFDFKASPKQLNNESTLDSSSQTTTSGESIKIGPPPANISADKKPTQENSKPLSTPISPLENYSGQVIFTYSKNANYYLTFFNTDYNWKGNTDTWKAIVNSLKIDQ